MGKRVEKGKEVREHQLQEMGRRRRRIGGKRGEKKRKPKGGGKETQEKKRTQGQERGQVEQGAV